MRSNRTGWGIVAVSMSLAALAQAEGQEKNGLSSDAFLRNALTTNARSLEALLDHPLNATLFTDSHINHQLHDLNARAVMEELVECALGMSQTLTYRDPLDHKEHVWRGELGLCQSSQTDAGDWSQNKPTEKCQQLVTACLMARVNRLGKAIPISLRGQPSVLFPLRMAVPTEQRFRESPAGEDPSEGTPIGSFSISCSPGVECNWASAYVGRCEGGEIQLSIHDRLACATTPLRVCAGIHGCLGPNSGHSPPTDFPSDAPYSRHIKDQLGACVSSPLKFTCPTEAPIGGYYSVMIRPDPMHTISPDAVRETPELGRYPATEKAVFTFREGAFYGNLFEPGELAWQCEVSNVPPHDRVCGSSTNRFPYGHVYACYSLTQQDDSQDDALNGAAYLNARICNQPDAECFPHTPQHCIASCGWVNETKIYQKCKGQGLDDSSKEYLPVTTYLNDPCDLIGNVGLCAQIRHPSAPPLPMPTGGGCCRSRSAAGGGPQAASTAVILAFLLRRRRKPAPGDRACDSPAPRP